MKAWTLVTSRGVRAARLMLADLDAVLTRRQWSLDLDWHNLLDACGLGQINRAGVTAAWARPRGSLRLTRKQPRRMTTIGRLGRQESDGQLSSTRHQPPYA
jgi:hypothetical protein